YNPVKNKYYLLYALFRNGNYDKALELAEDLAKKLENGHNWLRINDVYVLTLLHSGHYRRAMQVVQEVFTNRNFIRLSEHDKLKWSLNYGFLLITGVERTYVKGKSLNQVFEIIPDRDGQDFQMNLAIVVLQLALAVLEGKMDAIKELAREMSYYIYKHPVATYSPRSRMFLKLVNVMLKYDMDTKVCKKKGRYLYQQLKNTGHFGDAYSDMEVLPYEVLWEIFMERVEQETVNVA
ncbi:hypothetical protein ACFLU5_17950, partial [Bacteroidota bacterium]